MYITKKKFLQNTSSVQGTLFKGRDILIYHHPLDPLALAIHKVWLSLQCNFYSLILLHVSKNNMQVNSIETLMYIKW